MQTKEDIKLYNKRYSKENRDKWKVYYAENRLDRIQRARNWRLKNLERAISTRRAYQKTPKGRLNSTKSSAKTRNMEYSLTDNEAILLLSSDCHYCGKSNQQVGIDRLDSSIGYKTDNCVSCCWMCNRMKQIYSYKDFITQCKLISKNHS